MNKAFLLALFPLLLSAQTKIKPDNIVDIDSSTAVVLIENNKFYRLQLSSEFVVDKTTTPWSLKLKTAPSTGGNSWKTRFDILTTVPAGTTYILNGGGKTSLVGLVEVYLNGLLLSSPDDYTIDGVTLTMKIPMSAGGILRIQ